MGPPPLDPHRLLRWLPQAAGGIQGALRAVAQHTGLPVVLVAAVALVLSWRAFKQGARFAVEVLMATAVLVAATSLGWIRW